MRVQAGLLFISALAVTGLTLLLRAYRRDIRAAYRQLKSAEAQTVATRCGLIQCAM
jgi:hypothetical protein